MNSFPQAQWTRTSRYSGWISAFMGARTIVPPAPSVYWARLLVHRGQELRVRVRGLHLVEQELHRVDRGLRSQQLAQDPHAVLGGRVEQELLAAGRALVEVDRGVGAPV